ncbi:SIS domain-containing protein [Leptospira fluminis]|uniref:SIS domain-containing protein n=1 Tax=Leptospira fluminis TaxID=2484979 RepID=A0A4V3JED9_9LEPT|nr:SIS domain-containing protein [Leptospira fluminis]TGK17245.1 SIS domain-containing protein [Leptospira fluminis]
MKDLISNYVSRLEKVFSTENISAIETLAESLWDAWKTKKTVYICGNGGSAGNAIHLANDFNYGIDKGKGIGLRIEALPANSSVITCIANDEGYEFIFSQQLQVKADANDVLIVLSGSGNSPNILKALEVGNRLGMKTFAILGYSGGKAKSLAQHPIHFAIEDMQVSEDLQLIVGHILMQWMYKKGQESNS